MCHTPIVVQAQMEESKIMLNKFYNSQDLAGSGTHKKYQEEKNTNGRKISTELLKDSVPMF